MSEIANIKRLTPFTDELIESGADLSPYLQNGRAVPAMLEPQKVPVDFPAWVADALTREANRIGVMRQDLIKLWIVERLERPAPVSSGITTGSPSWPT